MSIEIIKYKEINKGSMLATFDIKIPKWGNVIIHNISLFQKNSHKWISMPSYSYEKDGEKKYFPYIRFESKDVAKKFEEVVLKALEEMAPRSTLADDIPKQMNIPF